MKEKAIFLFISIIGFSSCQNPKTNAKGELTAADTAVAIVQSAGELPSPMEMAILIKQSGAKYNGTLPNSISNIKKYATTASKTINLGVYCSDVGYTTLFKETQETMFFLNNCRKLSDEIGVSSAFDKSVFGRVEENIDKRDSLLGIITEAYRISNNYLKENNRYGTFMLMMAGGWVESMHLACAMTNENGLNTELASKIADQEIPLGKIITSMQPYATDADVNKAMQDLISIKKTYESGKLATKNEDGSEVIIDKVLLKSITAQIETVRKKFTQS